MRNSRLLLTLAGTIRSDTLITSTLARPTRRTGSFTSSTTLPSVLLIRFGIEKTLHAFALLIPPLLELLFSLDVLQIMFGSGRLADDIFLGLLLLQDSC